jgi:ABC-type uncharacterized transport system permease subunit
MYYADALRLLIAFLLLGSAACGPGAISVALRKSFGGGVAIIFGGIVAGIAGLILSLKLNQMQIEALRQAGHPVVNDMPGFGQLLLGAMGLLYFACVLLAVVAAVIWRRFLRRESGTA